MSAKIACVRALPGHAVAVSVDGWGRDILFNSRYIQELDALDDEEILEVAKMMNVSRHSAMATPEGRPTPIWAKEGMNRTVRSFNQLLTNRDISFFVD